MILGWEVGFPLAASYFRETMVDVEPCVVTTMALGVRISCIFGKSSAICRYHDWIRRSKAVRMVYNMLYRKKCNRSYDAWHTLTDLASVLAAYSRNRNTILEIIGKCRPEDVQGASLQVSLPNWSRVSWSLQEMSVISNLWRVGNWNLFIIGVL